MSQPPDNDVGFVKSASTFLERYTGKLREMQKDAAALSKSAIKLKERQPTPNPTDPQPWHLQSQHQILNQRLQTLQPACANFARVVSQRIEHGKLDELDKAELRLQLAEFEGELQAAMQAVNFPLPVW